MNTQNPLVVIDLRSYEYMLVDAISKLGLTDDRDVAAYIKINLTHLLTGSWLYAVNESAFKFIFVNDVKPYWREMELGKLGINYKGKRYKDAKRQSVLNFIHQTCEIFFANNGINICEYYEINSMGNIIGYEADDVAAAICLTQPTTRQIYVVTSDCDWLPFTSKPNVTWLSMPRYAPRLRDRIIALEWWNNHTYSNDTKAKRAFIKDDILKLWEFKAKFGDKSDNLRGDAMDQSKGKYIKFIDLWNPPTEYRLWENPIFSTIGLYETKSFTPISPEVFQKNCKNVSVALHPFSLNESAFKMAA